MYVEELTNDKKHDRLVIRGEVSSINDRANQEDHLYINSRSRSDTITIIQSCESDRIYGSSGRHIWAHVRGAFWRGRNWGRQAQPPLQLGTQSEQNEVKKKASWLSAFLFLCFLALQDTRKHLYSSAATIMSRSCCHSSASPTMMIFVPSNHQSE